MKRNIKFMSLVSSLVAIVILCAMLIGSTFAWFTDSATSSGNKIQSGSLKVDLSVLDENDNWVSIKDSNAPIFDYALWEPGYTEVRVLKVENLGTLALQWKAMIITENTLSELANVIDVYVCPSDTEIGYPENRSLDGYACVGTVADFVEGIESTTKGNLLGKSEAYLGIALKMQDKAGNDYQDLDLCGTFDIMIVATQLSSESDGYGSDYDANAPFDTTKIYTKNQLNLALANRESKIELMADIEVSNTLNVLADMEIIGNGYTLSRKSTTTMATTSESEVFTGNFFWVIEGATLELENVVVDGGAIWTGEINEVLQRGTENSGVKATGVLVGSNGPATVILNEGSILQNNGGANAVSIGTRNGSKLIINGGEIINNQSAAGAIWGGCQIILNSGKISYNHGGIGGAIRAVTNCNGEDGIFFAMYGGEMNHNLSDGNGGAIWAGSSPSNNVYVLNGGEMAYNYSKTTGGAMYAGYYEVVKIGGTFKMHHNGAPFYGAIRFHNHASLIMTGGEIYENGTCGLFLDNNSASITGGVITDNFGYSGGLGLTWGMAQVNGKIHFSLGTNHNTAYLAEEFGALNFTVNTSAANFAQFNFKPATGYTYTEGDEAKLVCLTEGYETYWDANTSTFRLRAI